MDNPGTRETFGTFTEKKGIKGKGVNPCDPEILNNKQNATLYFC
jgi:hypothetical protein